MSRRAFTLVELLIVVAIIAILVAMAMPLYLQAKETARMNTCVENLRQLGAALTQYMDDNDGFGLPPAPPDYYNPWILYPKPLRHYIGQSPTPIQSGNPKAQPRKLWVCPGDINRGSLETQRPYWWYCGASYMYPGPTAYISGKEPMQKDKPSDPLYPRKPLQWRNHRCSILLADFYFDFHTGRKVPHEYGEGSLTPDPLVMKIEAKGINILFLDLHVNSVTVVEREQYRKDTMERYNPYWEKDKN